MGVCAFKDEPRKNKIINKITNTDAQNIDNDINNEVNNNQPTNKECIINRISERTKFININNDYIISENILGKGATGIVREGQDKNGNKFAIKTVWKSDIKKNELFKKEIDISLEVSHESIIKCIDVYEDNSSLNFVLEEITGGDLFDHIIHSDDRKLTDIESMDLLEQMLEGLHYLHEVLGIVHRDVKPENFLLYKDGDKIRVKLIDFGFATYCKNDETMKEQLGTPQYAAPEIFEEKEYNSKVDMWSLGVVLYNMVKGTQPFGNRDIEKIKDQVLHKQINYDGFKNNELKNLCMCLLERNPEERYSAYQALSELRTIQNSYKTEGTFIVSFNSYKPDIHKIMFILHNDRTLKQELKNIFLAECNSEQLHGMFEEILSINSHEKKEATDTIWMVSEKLYLKAEKLIEYALNSKFAPENLKIRLKNYCEQKVIEKMKKQMINVDNFFTTLIESIKFIRKIRCFNEFKKIDNNNIGWISIKQLNNFFKDPTKKYNIKTTLKPNDKIEFETFYRIFNEYNGFKN